MMAPKGKTWILKVELTLEQQEQLQRAMGKEAAALDLTPERLEERIAPGGAASPPVNWAH
jgi:hypothetical protein